MSQAKVIDGTDQELTNLLMSGAFAGHKLRLIVDPEEEDSIADLPEPPFAIHSREQIIELLQASIRLPAHPVTEETWERRAKIAARNASVQ
ncbi:MAG: hypothetical protein JWQ02_4382 [Capsulimonas sp.]|nr:hypothetical protein [Capsulimonas sp.]